MCLFDLLILTTMVDKRPTAKESNGIGKHLKKLVRFGPPQHTGHPIPIKLSGSSSSSSFESAPDQRENLWECPNDQIDRCL